MGKFKKGHIGYWLGKRKPISQETRKKISQTLMGHSVSERVKRILAEKSPFKRGHSPWNKGKPWSEEMKKRISQTNKERGIEPKVKFVGFGENSPRWKGGNSKYLDCGKLLSSRDVKRCSLCFHLTHKGEKAYNWKGGVRTEHQIIRDSIEGRLWRTSVFRRDNWTCIWCGARGRVGRSVRLNAHHVKPFSDYPELRFAIDNGRTLCEDCHKTTETYGNRNKRR